MSTELAARIPYATDIFLLRSLDARRHLPVHARKRPRLSDDSERTAEPVSPVSVNSAEAVSGPCAQLAHFLTERLFRVHSVEELHLALDVLTEDEGLFALIHRVAESAQPPSGGEMDVEGAFASVASVADSAYREQMRNAGRIMSECWKARRAIAAAPLPRHSSRLPPPARLEFLTDISLPLPLRSALLAGERALICELALYSLTWGQDVPPWIVGEILERCVDDARCYLAALAGFPGVSVNEDVVPRSEWLDWGVVEAEHAGLEVAYRRGLSRARNSDDVGYPPCLDDDDDDA